MPFGFAVRSLASAGRVASCFASSDQLLVSFSTTCSPPLPLAILDIEGFRFGFRAGIFGTGGTVGLGTEKFGARCPLGFPGLCFVGVLVRFNSAPSEGIFAGCTFEPELSLTTRNDCFVDSSVSCLRGRVGVAAPSEFETDGFEDGIAECVYLEQGQQAFPNP